MTRVAGHYGAAVQYFLIVPSPRVRIMHMPLDLQRPYSLDGDGRRAGLWARRPRIMH